MVEIVRVTNDTEIEGIRLLQKENLKKLQKSMSKLAIIYE